MKKISFFLPNLEGGGAEKVIITLANKFKDMKYDVDLILVKNTGPYIALVQRGVNIVDFKKKRSLFSFISLFFYLIKNKPDFLVTSHPHTSLIAAFCIFLNFKRTKLLSRMGNKFNITFDQNKILNILNSFFIPFILKNSEKIILPSLEMKDEISNDYPIYSDKMIHISNPINFDEIDVLSVKKEKNFTKKNFILSVARLDKQKDLQTLIKAFAKISKRIDCNLLILGEGPERETLEKLIDNLYLNERIFMPGFVINPYYYIKKSDLFVLSSISEGMPNALLHALYLKKRVISTDCKFGTKELLSGCGSGTLIKCGDINDLAVNIESTLSKPFIMSHKEFLKKFEINKVIRNYESIIF